MNIKLTKADRQSILGRVRLVNDYFKNVWQNYERVMIIRRRNVKRRQPQEREIRELTRQNPHYEDNVSEALPENSNIHEGMLEPDPIDAESDGFHNQVTNIIPPQNDFKMDCDDTRMAYRVEYRKRLIGLLYGYLYQAYGKGIPTGLGHYLDFAGISRDAQIALNGLNAWWDAKGEGQTLPSYAAYHNDLLTRRAHQDYDKKAYRWMDSLVRKNSFHKSSKRVIRIDKKGDDDWVEDYSPYRLGSTSVNALLYWLTAHHQLPIRDKQHRYQDHDFQEGMNRLNNHYLSNVRIYKDRSYSIAFRSAKVADEVSRILQHEAEAFRYEAYVHKIKDFSDDFHKAAIDTQNVQLSSTLINTNIHDRFDDTPHKAYRFLGLLKKTFQRFQDEIGRQIVKGHIPDKSDWEYPTALSNIRAYYQGIRQTYQGFSLDTFQDILDSQNINKVILDNAYSDNAYPDTYRKIHRTIGRFSNAYRDNDIGTCYQNLGIQQGLRLVFKNLPVAYQQVAKRYAD